MQHPFPAGTQVTFDIEDLVLGTAIVSQTEFDEGWLYRLTSVEITRGDIDTLRRLATESDGDVWACDHEVLPRRHANAGGAA
ncbi:MAG: hypothetical protein ACK5Q5_04820 [Planctomycetaceae bacterium]